MPTLNKSILLVGHASGRYISGAELSLIDNLKSLVALGRRVVVIIPNEDNPDYISRIREFTQEIYFVHIPWNIANNKADSDIIERIVEIANITNAEMIFFQHNYHARALDSSSKNVNTFGLRCARSSSS